eukprot:14063819-Alexandrium_andersonii.AAC.1
MHMYAHSHARAEARRQDRIPACERDEVQRCKQASSALWADTHCMVAIAHVYTRKRRHEYAQHAAI